MNTLDALHPGWFKTKVTVDLAPYDLSQDRVPRQVGAKF